MIAKLLKYELLRRKGPLTAFAVIFIVLEGLLLFGLFKGDAWIGLSIFMTILLIGGTYVFVLLDAVFDNPSITVIFPAVG